jgi:uncharacterized protein (TIGR04255 family)
VNEHEVYPKAPVVLVALEVRHPTADPLTPAETRAIKKRLSEHFPLESTGQATNVQLMVGATRPDVNIENFTRFLNRTKTMAVSFRREAIAVEASEYPGWRKFSELITEALAAREETSPVDGVERVGLRYIDEVRVPGNGDTNWADWMADSMLGPPADAIDLHLGQWQGVGVYGNQPGQMLVMRYGPRTGYALDPNSDLRRVRPTDGGSFFLVDIDSFWTPDGEVPEFDRDMLASRCEELHGPIRKLFEGVIKDRLRNEVLRAND